MSGQCLGRMADYGLAYQKQELFWRLGLEPAAGAGGNKDSGNSHTATVTVSNLFVNWGRLGPFALRAGERVDILPN